jgi:hypothetical protein
MIIVFVKNSTRNVWRIQTSRSHTFRDVMLQIEAGHSVPVSNQRLYLDSAHKQLLLPSDVIEAKVSHGDSIYLLDHIDYASSQGHESELQPLSRAATDDPRDIYEPNSVVRKARVNPIQLRRHISTNESPHRCFPVGSSCIWINFCSDPKKSWRYL